MNDYADLKRECYEANLLLPHHRLIDLTFGNVSVGRPGTGHLCDQAERGRLRAPEGGGHRGRRNRNRRGGRGRAAVFVRTPTHRRLYQAFGANAGVQAVVHTHSRHAVAWAQAGRGIPCLGTTHADYFYGEVPITRPLSRHEISREYEWETGNVIVERFRSARIDPAQVSAVLVHGHGPFAWGPTGLKAVENALALEIVAEMAMKTLQLDPRAWPISQALIDKHFLRKHGANAYYGQKGAV